MDHFWIALMFFILGYIIGNCRNKVIEGLGRRNRNPGQRQRKREAEGDPDLYDSYREQVDAITERQRAQQRPQRQGAHH